MSSVPNEVKFSVILIAVYY